ncbi:sodium-independent anion transporter [Ramlibacter sp.]|uniref:sodium-independent anion transporter n=1 Tax=Ramlibacter sp. TaxID=1917967 RepID=UPI002614795B|nr:sodium-independent anion transporter [Ramlibacter sp.]
MAYLIQDGVGGAVLAIRLDLSSVSRVGLTAVEALQRLHRDLHERGIELHLAKVRGRVMDRLAQTNLPQNLAHKPFLSLHEAAGALVPAPKRPRPGP